MLCSVFKLRELSIFDENPFSARLQATRYQFNASTQEYFHAKKPLE